MVFHWLNKPWADIGEGVTIRKMFASEHFFFLFGGGGGVLFGEADY